MRQTRGFPNITARYVYSFLLNPKHRLAKPGSEEVSISSSCVFARNTGRIILRSAYLCPRVHGISALSNC